MKSKSFRPLFSLSAIVLMMLACGFLGSTTSSGGSTPAGQSSQSNQSNQSNVTNPPAATEPPSQASQKYFQEDFNSSLSGWSHFVVNGKDYSIFESDPPSFSMNVEDGFLVFDLKDIGLWAYAVYDGQQYDNVRVDVSAENRGTNDNSISLVCRYSTKNGWYEFNITNGGLYNILYAQITPDKKVSYSRIADGGSNKIKQGKATNLYSIICKGHTLTLFINNVQTRTIDDNDYVLNSGEIGLSVSSFNNPPDTVGYDWVKISQP